MTPVELIIISLISVGVPLSTAVYMVNNQQSISVQGNNIIVNDTVYPIPTGSTVSFDEDTNTLIVDGKSYVLGSSSVTFEDNELSVNGNVVLSYNSSTNTLTLGSEEIVLGGGGGGDVIYEGGGVNIPGLPVPLPNDGTFYVVDGILYSDSFPPIGGVGVSFSDGKLKLKGIEVPTSDVKYDGSTLTVNGTVVPISSGGGGDESGFTYEGGDVRFTFEGNLYSNPNDGTYSYVNGELYKNGVFVENVTDVFFIDGKLKLNGIEIPITSGGGGGGGGNISFTPDDIEENQIFTINGIDSNVAQTDTNYAKLFKVMSGWNPDNNKISVGTFRTDGGLNSIAIGQSTCEGGNSISIGYDSNCGGTASIAFGNNAVCGGGTSIAIGYDVDCSGNYSIASGNNTSCEGDDSISSGNNVVCGGNTSISIGSGTNCAGDNSISFGKNAICGSSTSIAVGNDASCIGATDSVAIGSVAKCEGSESISFGYKVICDGNNSISIGNSSKCEGDYSIAVGTASCSGDNSISVGSALFHEGEVTPGTDATCEGNFSISVGHRTSCDGENSISIGRNTSCDGENSISIGNDSKCTGGYSISIGTGASSDANSISLGDYISSEGDVMIGYSEGDRGKINVGNNSSVSVNASLGISSSIDPTVEVAPLTQDHSLIITINGEDYKIHLTKV